MTFSVSNIKRHFSNNLIRKVFLTLFVQGGAQALIIFLSIVMARNLSMHDFGEYSFGYHIAMLTATIACFGAGPILAKRWGELELKCADKRLVIYQMHNSFFLKGGVLVLLCILMFWLVFKGSIERISYLLVFPLFVIMLQNNFHVAIKEVITGNMIQLIRGFFVLFCALIASMFIQDSMFVLIVLLSSIFISIAVFVQFGRHYSFQRYRFNIKGTFSFTIQHWASVLFVNVDIIILKLFSSSDSIGLYSVALFLSSVSSFGLYAINSNTLSRISESIHRFDNDELQAKITSYAKISTTISSVFLVSVLLFGWPVVQLYGVDYSDAYLIFCILAVGQIFNVLCGSVGLILNMFGLSNVVTKAIFMAIVIKAMLGWYLFSNYGVYGVALAAAVAMSYWNISLFYYLVKNKKLNPTVFNLI